MLMRKMLVLAVEQAGLGAPGAPTPASDAILARTAMPKLLEAEYVKRPLLKGTKGNDGNFVVGEHNVIEFETELGHVGAAGSAHPLAPLFMGVGFNETLTPGVSAVYALHSDDPTYLTIWCYLDKVIFKIEDAWGTVSAEMNAKNIIVLKWKFVGKYVPMVDGNVPTNASFVPFLKPLPLSKVNTPTFTLHGYAVKAQAFGWDLAADVKWRELLNQAGVDSNDRQPTGSCTFELTTVAAKNWAETARLGTEAPVQMIHGAGAGKVVQMDMPKVQFSADPTLQDSEGHAMLAGRFTLNRNVGDDELVLTFK